MKARRKRDDIAHGQAGAAGLLPGSSAAWIAGLLFAAVLIAYSPVLHSGFIWDDDDYVTQNETLRTARGLRDIWMRFGATPQYYPLVHTTFWIEYRLWGLNAAGYHLVNVLLHAANALLLWLVLARLGARGALLAAFVFALHPVHVESAAWITERKNLLSGCFYLLSALAYMRFSGLGAPDGAPSKSARRDYALALALFVCALLSKTVTSSLPAALLVVTWWKRGRIARRDVMPLIPFFVVGIALSLVTVWMEKWHVGAAGTAFQMTPAERVLVAGRAPWFYAWKLAWPANLLFIYPRWKIDPHALWQYLFPLATAALLAVLWLMRARIGRAPLAAALFFGGTLVPALGFFDVFPMQYSYVADHFQYHASIGLIALGAAGLVMAAERLALPHAATRAAACALLAALAFLTWKQTAIYKDLLTLWQATLAGNPGSPMVRNNLANALIGIGRAQEAIDHYEAALRVDPNDHMVHFNYGVTMHRIGRLDLALKHLGEAIRTDPTNGMAHFHKAGVLEKLDRLPDAERSLREALRLKPDFTEARSNLGTILMRQGRKRQAIAEFEQATRDDPSSTKLLYNLSGALLDAGEKDKAAGYIEQALRLNPNDAMGHYQLGIVLGETGRSEQAANEFRRTVELEPDHADAHYNLAVLQDKAGRAGEAAVHFGEVVRLSPGDAQARLQLGASLRRAGKLDEAREALREALRLRPGWPEAQRELDACVAKVGPSL